MKKNFEKPTLESYEYVVAARLAVSGGGGNEGGDGGNGDYHSNGQGSDCARTPGQAFNC